MGKVKCSGCGVYVNKQDALYANALTKFCSDGCRKRHATQHAPTRSKGTAVATDVRETVMRRDRGRCRWCGTTKNLEIHHCHYRSEHIPALHEETNLLILCRTCHMKAHSSKRKWQGILEETISLTYSGVMLTVPQVEARRERSLRTDPLQGG